MFKIIEQYYTYMTTSVSRRYSMYKVQDSRVLDKYAVNPVMGGFTFYSVM